MSQLASDNFTRANENPLSNGGKWTIMSGSTGSLQILSNRCQPTDNTQLGGAIWTGLVWPNDQYSELTVQAVQSGADIRVMVRSNSNIGTNTSYFVQILGVGASQSVKLFKDVAGTFTQLGTTQTVTVTAGDVFRCEAQGTTIRAKQNGSVLVTQVDAAIASGSAGFEMSAAGTAALTNGSAWAGGDFASLAGSVNPGFSLNQLSNPLFQLNHL
jgi:hypothetical protein